MREDAGKPPFPPCGARVDTALRQGGKFIDIDLRGMGGRIAGQSPDIGQAVYVCALSQAERHQRASSPICPFLTW